MNKAKTIYRVQHKESECGPYSPGYYDGRYINSSNLWAYERWRWKGGYSVNKKHRPSPSRLRDRGGEYFRVYSEHRFGFRTLNGLRHWFGRQGLRGLRTGGFQVVKLRAPILWQWHGQVIFHFEESTVVSVL